MAVLHDKQAQSRGQMTVELKPPSTYGLHAWIMDRAVYCSGVGLSATAAAEAIARTADQHGTRRKIPAREIEDAVSAAFRLRPKRGQWCPSRRLKVTSYDNKKTKNLLDDKFHLADLWERSPVRLDDRPVTREILSRVYDSDDLLCIGSDPFSPLTRKLGEWQDTDLSNLQLIVPNPMQAREGLTKEGNLSARALSNSSPESERRFVIYEHDQELDINQQAAVIWKLHEISPFKLVLAVHSGGKSLHGWFYTYGGNPEQVDKFKRVAVVLGGDPATMRLNQFCRLPDGLRDNGNRQSIMYFEPEALS